MADVRKLVDSVAGGARPGSVLRDALADKRPTSLHEEAFQADYGAHQLLTNKGFQHAGDSHFHDTSNGDDHTSHYTKVGQYGSFHHVAVNRMSNQTTWAHHENNNRVGTGVGYKSLALHLTRSGVS